MKVSSANMTALKAKVISTVVRLKKLAITKFSLVSILAFC